MTDRQFPMRLLQIWVTNTRDPKVVKEMRRQSKLVAAGAAHLVALAGANGALPSQAA